VSGLLEWIRTPLPEVEPAAAPYEFEASDIAGHVRAEMARHNRAGRELADLLGVSTAAISRRMRGHVPFRADEVIAIAGWLGVPVDALLPPPAAS
jgi:transcriptional regulator with XRE-family HTH domain